MQNPATYNITAYQGATYKLDMTYKIDDTPVDLTNYTAAMQVKENPNASAVISISNGSGITLGGTAGTIALNVSATTMGSATAGFYQYDLELNSAGEVTRLLQGRFEIIAEVTR